jgi:hypothetical protein
MAMCAGRRRPRARARQPAPRLRGSSGRGRHSAMARMGGQSAAADQAAHLLSGTASGGQAQARLRHVAAGFRPHAGAAGRPLRGLRRATRPHPVRRSLPCHRQGARAPLQPMQSRHRPVQGQPGPPAQGGRLYRSLPRRIARRCVRVSRAAARRCSAETALAARRRATRQARRPQARRPQARRPAAAGWRSAACCG